MMNRDLMQINKFILAILILTLLFYSKNTLAEVTLSAEEKVEWHQNEGKVIAVGNAVATKDKTQINANKMTGFYKKDQANKIQISRIIAEKDITIKTPSMSAYGNKLDYDTDSDEMFLQGSPAKIKTQNATITATKGIKYFPNENKAIAVGEVVAKDEKNTIYADNMTSYFDNSSGNLEIVKVEISGNVKVVSPEAIVKADRGEFIVKEELIRLFENVTISQGENVLNGDYAETNVKTGVSRLLARKSGGRVSGVFKENKKEEKK